jgi:TENA/THI-4/PQQC family
MLDELAGEQPGQEPMRFFERLKTAASAEWRVYTEHPFTNAMADGLLAETAFRHYLVQDYLFLIEFARAYALAVYKSPKLADMREAAAGLSAILDVEMNLHVKLCAGWGLSPHDLERAPPAVEMLAYTRYVLDTGMRGDLLALQVALAPCVIGLRGDRGAAFRAARGACRNEPLSRVDRRICRCALPGGRGESAGALGAPCRFLFYARPRGRANSDLQGSHAARN